LEVAGSWHLRLLFWGGTSAGSFPNCWDQEDGGLSFLASDRLAGRSIQFAAGVGESNQPGECSTATPEQRLVETPSARADGGGGVA